VAAKRQKHLARSRSQSARPTPAAASRAPARSRFAVICVLAALLVTAGTWAYATSFAGVFVLDDVRAIARNPTIRALSTSLSPPTASTVAGRPVANLSFAVNYALAPPDARDVFVSPAHDGPDGADGLLRNVWGYHVLNLAIHLAAGLALFGVVRRTLSAGRLRATFEASASWLAFVVALVWLVHPLQTASVTYVVQRVESLMGLFYLLTLYCAIRAAEGVHARAWTAGAILSCALGMGTKEVMVTAPLMVWLWDRAFGDGRRVRWPLVAGLAATWLILAALVLHEHRAPSLDVGGTIVFRYLLTQTGVVTHYLRLVLVPSPLVFLHTWPIATSAAALAPHVVLIAVLVGLTTFGIVRRHPLGFAGAWFFLILAPTSSLLPIVTEVAAEQRMYLPLAAVVVCAVVGMYLSGRSLLARLMPGSLSRHAGLALAAVLTVALVAVFGTATRARNRDYWSEQTLWRDTVVKQPGNERARVAYGVALLSMRRFADAEAQLQVAVDLDRVDPMAESRLGAAQAAQGKLENAIVHLERAVALRPDDVDAHRWLGQAYAIRQQDALAVPHFMRALEVQGDDPVLLGHLAQILADSRDGSVRDGARALVLAERAVALTSRGDARTLDILAVAQAAVGRFREAATTVEEALRLARARGDQALVSELEYRAAAYRERQDFRPPQ
jgi:Flp pilus assembly protein TadD